LLSLLEKLKEDEIEIELEEEALLVKGKGRRAKIRMRADIKLPIDEIEEPDDWSKLDPKLVDAMETASQCCSNQDSVFVLTCVCIDEKNVMATDNFQILVYPIKTGIEEPLLLRGNSVRNLSAIEPKKWSLTNSWAHFKRKMDWC
jgi:hypothetical protein